MEIEMCVMLLYFFMLIQSGIAIKRNENAFREFDFPLREKYKCSYIRPDKVVCFVRKCYGLNKCNRVHRITCVLHYLQIVMVVSPVFLLPAFVFVPLEKVGFVCLLITLAPCALFVYVLVIFSIFQYFRCLKIKKTDSTCAKLQFHDRRDI